MKKIEKGIKAWQMKPGMVIQTGRGCICLILAKEGRGTVQYTHLDYQQAYGGALVGTIKGEEMIKVLKGKKRKAVINSIKKEVFRNLHDIEVYIDMIRLIEAMEGL